MHLWRTFVFLSWTTKRNPSWHSQSSLSFYERSWSSQERSRFPPRTIVDVLYCVLESTSHAFSLCVRPYYELSRPHAEQLPNPKIYMNIRYPSEEHLPNNQIIWSLSSAYLDNRYPLTLSHHHFFSMHLFYHTFFIRGKFYSEKMSFVDNPPSFKVTLIA
jgi:hypothetical protein